MQTHTAPLSRILERGAISVCCLAGELFAWKKLMRADRGIIRLRTRHHSDLCAHIFSMSVSGFFGIFWFMTEAVSDLVPVSTAGILRVNARLTIRMVAPAIKTADTPFFVFPNDARFLILPFVAPSPKPTGMSRMMRCCTERASSEAE